MKKRLFWFTLSSCALVAVAVLWWGQASLVEPEDAPPSATASNAMGLTPAAEETSPSQFSAPPSPVSPKVKPMQSQSPPTAQTFSDPGEMKDTANPPLITAAEKTVRDTGEFLDPDAEIPRQSINDEAEPMDSGPFINADPPPH